MSNKQDKDNTDVDGIRVALEPLTHEEGEETDDKEDHTGA